MLERFENDEDKDISDSEIDLFNNFIVPQPDVASNMVNLAGNRRPERISRRNNQKRPLVVDWIPPVLLDEKEKL